MLVARIGCQLVSKQVQLRRATLCNPSWTKMFQILPISFSVHIILSLCNLQQVRHGPLITNNSNGVSNHGHLQIIAYHFQIRLWMNTGKPSVGTNTHHNFWVVEISQCILHVVLVSLVADLQLQISSFWSNFCLST